MRRRKHPRPCPEGDQGGAQARAEDGAKIEETHSRPRYGEGPTPREIAGEIASRHAQRAGKTFTQYLNLRLHRALSAPRLIIDQT